MGEENLGNALNASTKDSFRSNRTSDAIISVKIPQIPMPTAKSDVTTARQWNTSKLGLRVDADALSAAAAGALVAPIITMIDKGIIENASGRNTLKESLKNSARELLTRPQRFIASKPFALIFVRSRSSHIPQHHTYPPSQSLYFGTYFTANTIDTASSTLSNTSASSTTAGTPKFLATSSANLALCLYKDNKFTQLFGSTATSHRPVPLPTFALFTIRDCLTIFASFNLPPLLAPKFEQHMSANVQKYMSSASAAQFATPAAVQLFSTPLHLLGLDLYNRPAARMGGADGRVAAVLRNWAISAAARVCRIVPAFGVGGVVNMKVRKRAMGRLE